MATRSDSVDTVIELVSQRCHEYAEALAADGVGGPLTYQELWARSGALARALVAGGVRVEDRVGLWAAQSSDLLVGMLGIQRAGAAYVPLDPTLPEARLAQLVEGAGITAMVAPGAGLEAAGSIVPRVYSSTAPEHADAELPAVRGDNAAYVIYTSGSTGTPKAVVVEHRSVVLLLDWIAEQCELAPGGRVLGTVAPTFDASVPMLLFPLARGATFVAIRPEVARDARALVETIAAVRPSVVTTAPTMLRMLTEVGWEGGRDVEVWTGGERTAPDVISYLVPRLRSLCNWYGPTEATVQVALGRLGVDDLESPVRIEPPHAKCLVLDAELHPVAPGVEGELYIIGDALARGYLGDPALTASRFLTIVHDGAEVRAYRTGDKAVRRADGSLVLLGRLDDQLNVRGYRVEPREVEDALRAHPGVGDAVVVATETELDADRQLVAYVVGAPELTGAELRDFARERLPAHLVPLVVLVESYPLTTSGKVDRRTLARLATFDHGGVQHDATAELANATDLERTVVEVFAEVLGLPVSRIGLDDDFFDLGGTSLRNLRLFMQLEERLGVRLPLSTLTTAATPRLVALAIASERRRGRTSRGDGPRHEWERILSALWRDVLGLDEVARDDSFFDLGGTPAEALRVIDRLADLYDVHISLAEFEETPTIAELATTAARRNRHSVLVPLTTDGDGPTLFLICGAGGLAVTFLPLARLVGPGQPVVGLQARGIEQRAFPDLTFSQTAARYVRAIREVQPHGPYLVGGHSLGGVHALNVAHRLRDEGEEVALLAIFDAHLTRRMVGRKRLSRDDHAHGIPGNDGPRGLPRLRTVVHLPFIGLVQFRGASQFEVFAALGEIQAAACGALRPYDGRTLLFLSDDDESALIEARWSRLLTGDWDTARVPGSHIAMLEQANIAAAAKVLREELGELRASPSS